MSAKTLFYCLLLLLCCLLLITPVLGEITPFYHDWIYPGDTFTANGVLYALGQGSSSYSVLLTRGTDDYVISYGDCVLSNDGHERYCFAESDYVDCQRGDYECADREGYASDWCCPYDVGHVKFEAGKALYAAYLELYNVTPVISVTRTPAKTSLKLEEQVEVKVVMQNEGDDAVVNAKYVEHVPEGFRTVSSPGFTRSGGDLLLSFNINPGDTKTFTYTVRPKSYVSGTFTGNLTYEYKSSPQRISPTAFTINVPSPFEVTHTLTPSSIPVGQQAAYVFTLKNNEASAEMEATVSFSGLSKILKELPDGLTETDGLPVWKGTLAAGEEERFEFDLSSTRTGSFPITANLLMMVAGEEFTHTVQDTLSATATPLQGEIRLSKEPLRAGQPYTVRVLLDNKGGNVPFSDFYGSLAVGSSLRSLKLDAIAPGDAILLGEFTLTAPLVNSTTGLSFSLKGSYGTRYGENFALSASKEVSVTPATAEYGITLQPNATETVPGGTISVTVKVQNLQESYRTVNVADTLPSGAFVSGGVRQKEMSLKTGEEREAYTYLVTLPESQESDTFTITTQVFDEQSGESYAKSVDIAVKLPEASPSDETGNATGGDGTDTGASEEKKPGLLRRVADAIVGFFEGLFS